VIVLSPALIVSPAGDYPLSYPMVGWHNVVTIGNVTADSEAAGYPVTNLANSSTANRWLSALTAEQLVTVSDIDAGLIDYVGIARHWLDGATVSVEAITAEPGADWEEVHPGMIVAGTEPIVLQFEPGFYIGVRLRIIPDGVEPAMAVLFVGKSLVLQRSMQAGFTPIADAKENGLVTGWSQSGEHLGSILDGAMSSNSADLKALDPDWYRDTMRPFVVAGNAGEPFFFAWDPEHHPDEVGFCVFSGPVRPVVNYLGGKEIDISIPINAVAL
jgi:hypothetical protein